MRCKGLHAPLGRVRRCSILKYSTIYICALMLPASIDGRLVKTLSLESYLLLGIKILPSLFMSAWRNGRRAALRWQYLYRCLGSSPITDTKICSINAVGSVPSLQVGSRRFEPVIEHHCLLVAKKNGLQRLSSNHH